MAASTPPPRDLAEGESVEVKGSAARPYVLTLRGGVYSCTCPAWRNQGAPIERRTCKHLRGLRGEAAEAARLGNATPPTVAPRPAASGPSPGDGDDAAGDAGAVDAGVRPPPLLLAHSWENDGALSGWWMSEKLDGVRAYWDGQRFLSRLGNPYHAPDWFVAQLPNVPLDGELWCGRKRFQRTVSIVRRQDENDDWREVSYVVFDAPALRQPFEDEADHCRNAVAPGPGLPARGRLPFITSPVRTTGGHTRPGTAAPRRRPVSTPGRRARD